MYWSAEIILSRAQMARERARLVRQRTGLLLGQGLETEPGHNTEIQELCSALQRLKADRA